MRILLTAHQFLPQFAAGTEVLTHSVARELQKRGHVVHVLTGHPGSANLADEDRFDEYDLDQIHVYRFHHSYIAVGSQTSAIELGYDNRLAVTYFERILKTFKPDLVHFFHLNRLGTGLIECAVELGVPRFMTPTDFWVVCPTGQLLLSDGSSCAGPSAHAGNCVRHVAQNTQKGFIRKAAELLPTAWVDLLVRLTKNGTLPSYPKRAEVVALAKRWHANVLRLNMLNGLVVPNGFMREFLVRQGVIPRLITEVAFGIEVTEPAVRAEQRERRQPLRVAFIGTLAPHKGCHVLIEAFKMLPDAGASLKIYGRSEDFPDYVRKLKSLAGDHKAIEFCGTFPNSEIAQIFVDIDVLVVPSLWYENSPLVLYSAQAARCTVVASNLPGIADVIHGDVNGLLFESGNSSDLARQLLRLLNEEGLLQRLGAQARAPKSTEKYVDELLAIWRGVE
ncbi:D-inositol 3-phosphate glycosyltransferase [Azoarcus sp. Aa7]|nr:D-inositol 3-phosphate glycosyltransferase [Azoarcus sp. Aa7]